LVVMCLLSTHSTNALYIDKPCEIVCTQDT
jgi:hypothetical protein